MLALICDYFLHCVGPLSISPLLLLAYAASRSPLSQHDGKGPSTTAERKEFSAAVLKQKRNNDEENFDEAVTYFRRAGTKHGVTFRAARRWRTG